MTDNIVYTLAAAGATVLVSQPGKKPSRKVAAAGVGSIVGAVVTILALVGIVVPDDLAADVEQLVEAAAVTIPALTGWIAAYLTRERA